MKYWKAIKLYRKIVIRFLTDLITRDVFKFCRKSEQEINFQYCLSLRQEIKQSTTFESKLYNFSIASNKINSYVIQPNEIFSFWEIIGNPNRQFRKGRTLQNGKIIEDIGGGLCQVSGIIYYVSLLAGLEILERHNHSVDIYNDETRFCPLGTDATLVYGYKDLRIMNKNSFPIKFEIKVIGESILIKLLSIKKIKEHILDFKTEKNEDYTLVRIVNNAGEVINTSKYKNL